MHDPDDTEPHAGPRRDKQLQGIVPDVVMEKRRLDQALNAKEFAVCAGVSYSTARHWFRLPGFPAVHGVVFWPDFVRWRTAQHAFTNNSVPPLDGEPIASPPNLPPRAAQILHDA